MIDLSPLKQNLDRMVNCSRKGHPRGKEVIPRPNEGYRVMLCPDCNSTYWLPYRKAPNGEKTLAMVTTSRGTDFSR